MCHTGKCGYENQFGDCIVQEEVPQDALCAMSEEELEQWESDLAKLESENE